MRAPKTAPMNACEDVFSLCDVWYVWCGNGAGNDNDNGNGNGHGNGNARVHVMLCYVM